MKARPNLGLGVTSNDFPASFPIIELERHAFDYSFKRFRRNGDGSDSKPAHKDGPPTALEEKGPIRGMPSRPRAAATGQQQRPLGGDAGWLLSPGNARLISLHFLSNLSE
jgi:hypothetical protein